MPTAIPTDVRDQLIEDLDTRFKAEISDSRHTTGAARQVVDAFIKEAQQYAIPVEYFTSANNLQALEQTLYTQNQEAVSDYLKSWAPTRTVSGISVSDTINKEIDQCILPEEIAELKKQLNTEFEELYRQQVALTRISGPGIRHTEGAANQIVDAFVRQLQEKGVITADKPDLGALVESLR